MKWWDEEWSRSRAVHHRDIEAARESAPFLLPIFERLAAALTSTASFVVPAVDNSEPIASEA
jgi:hypothetical protein